MVDDYQEVLHVGFNHVKYLNSHALDDYRMMFNSKTASHRYHYCVVVEAFISMLCSFSLLKLNTVRLTLSFDIRCDCSANLAVRIGTFFYR